MDIIALWLTEFFSFLQDYMYRVADKRPTRKETNSEACQGRARFQQHRDARYHKVFFLLQGKAPKEIHAILIETLACFLPGRAKNLSAPRKTKAYFLMQSPRFL